MTAQDTAQRFFRSAGAATFSQLWRVGVAFATRLLLRRFIAPEDWGLWDWSLPLFLVLGAVRDLGLLYHVARVKPRPYGNLLAMELGWGAVMVVAILAGAPILSLGYSEPNPDVVPIIQLLAAFLFFEGLAAIPRVYFENELKVGRAVLPEILRNLTFAVTSVALAVAGYGVWALAIGQVASVVIYAAHLWLRARGRIPLHFERGRTLALVRDSLPLALIWFLLILTRHVDPFILAARFPGAVVGNYVFAYETAFLAATILVPAVQRALYPALIAFAEDRHQLFAAFRLATLAVSALEAPAALFLFVNAELVLQILGGGAWVEAPAYLRILCFAPLVDPFSRLGGEVLKALHRDRFWILCSGLTLGSLCALGVVLTLLLGPAGMAWANFLPLGGLLMAWDLHRRAPGPMRALLRDLAWIYLAPLPLLLPLYFLLPDDPKLRFSLSLAAIALVLALVVRRFGRSFLDFLRDPLTASRQAASS